MTARAHGGSLAVGYVADGGRVAYHAAPRPQASWPHQVGVIPSRAQSFQRRAEAERLRAAFDGSGTATLGHVLTGMGGVGKTQLAADYDRTAWDAGGLDVLVWVTAGARSAVVTGYAQAGVELCRADPDDPEQAARSFLAWLTPKDGRQQCRWLIVLDDVADPEDLYGLWPPDSPSGRTLVTTRRRDAALTGEGRGLVEVGLFTEAEAVAYLTGSLAVHGRADPTDQISALAADLGHLALALAQAAAYLVASGETMAAYRGLLADRATTLADLAPDALPDEQAVALAAAWSLSIDHADRLRPAGTARPMLHLAAVLDANGIPHSVLTGEVARGYLAAHRTGRHPTEEPTPLARRDAVRALRALNRLSLIDHTPDTPHQAVRVHQLIQRATRDTLTLEQRELCARTAADALNAAWPAIERDTALAQALRANTTAVTRVVEDALYRPAPHTVLFRAGESLGQSHQFGAAAHYYRHLMEAAHRRLGPGHPDTLRAGMELAHGRGQAGDTTGAVAAAAGLRAAHERVHGPDHPGTLDARYLLANWQGEAGDAAGGVASFAGLLEDMVRVNGPDHPKVLNTRAQIAFWRGKAGGAAGAVAAFAELLEDMVRVHGPDHAGTLTARHDLARWLGESGDVAGAVHALTELLVDQSRVLGPDHPGTLSTRHSLATGRGLVGARPGRWPRSPSCWRTWCGYTARTTLAPSPPGTTSPGGGPGRGPPQVRPRMGRRDRSWRGRRCRRGGRAEFTGHRARWP
ncbi:tetratricopeptide repeat protein [Streptomyces sp. NPDC058052]|uniref:tetratricopeptide repeat protein n=1 Tax=Streptomyces sp. NPDC058052 TaxID=3346316 RepID=UPI0036EAD16C